MRSPEYALRIPLIVFILLVPFLPSLAQLPEATSSCPTADGADGCACLHHGMHTGELPEGPAGLRLFERMSSELALTETQKQELGTLIEMYRPRIQELAKRAKTSTQALLDVAPDDPSYSSRAVELSERAGATAAEMVTLLAELQSSAYALLTSEQQARFMQLRAEQRERMEQLRSRMQERRTSGDWQPGMGFLHGKCCHHCKTESASDPISPLAGE